MLLVQAFLTMLMVYCIYGSLVEGVFDDETEAKEREKDNSMKEDEEEKFRLMMEKAKGDARAMEGVVDHEADAIPEAQEPDKDNFMKEDDELFPLMMEKATGDARALEKEDDEPPKDTYSMTEKEHKDLVSLNTNAKLLTLQKLCNTTVVQKGCYSTTNMKLKGTRLTLSNSNNQKPNNANELERLVCECSTKAVSEGYQLFGIQSSKDCWGYTGESKDLATKAKPATNCESTDGVVCKPATEKKVEDRVCSGTNDTAFIYETLEKAVHKLKKHCRSSEL
eukprot:Seg4722.1 transcript_id=Seg4722.1/GoldUCD/mRNA.D3Y31 product="hypothetical protein" protein_id=Seg4722.1/GoldUCD/D3Y31